MANKEQVIQRLFEFEADTESFINHVKESTYLYCSGCKDRKDSFDYEDEGILKCRSCGKELSIEHLLKHDQSGRNKDTIISYLKDDVCGGNDGFNRDYRKYGEQLKELEIEEEKEEEKVLTSKANSGIINTESKINNKGVDNMGITTTTATNGNGAMNLFGGLNMGNMFGEMGAINDGRFKFSMLGVAIKDNNGNYVCYNKENGTLTDTMGMTFDMPDMFLAMPTGAVIEGDLILQNGKPLYVTERIDDNKVKCINPVDSLEQIVILKKSPFGFNFYTKVFSMMEMFMPKDSLKDGNFNPSMFMLPMLLGGLGGQQQGEGQQGLQGVFSQMLPLMILPQLMGGKSGENPLTNMFNFGGQNQKKEVIEIDTDKAKDGRTLEYKILEMKERIAKREEEKMQKAELKKLEQEFADLEKEEE